MPLRKGSARAGFQIAFKADGSLFIGELDDDVKVPSSAGCCVRAAPSVVVGQPRFYIGREADIKLGSLICVSQNVDESLVADHCTIVEQVKYLAIDLKCAGSSQPGDGSCSFCKRLVRRRADFYLRPVFAQ